MYVSGSRFSFLRNYIFTFLTRKFRRAYFLFMLKQNLIKWNYFLFLLGYDVHLPAQKITLHVISVLINIHHSLLLRLDVFNFTKTITCNKQKDAPSCSKFFATLILLEPSLKIYKYIQELNSVHIKL